MGRKKTIPLLVPREVLDNLNKLIAEDVLTLDQLTAWLREEHGISIPRSTLGDFAKDIREELDEINRSREVARAFVQELGQDSTDENNRLLIEMTQAVALKMLRPQLKGEAPTFEPKELAAVARASKDAVIAGRHGVELRDKIRREVAAEARQGIAAVAKERGLSADVVEELQKALKGT